MSQTLLKYKLFLITLIVSALLLPTGLAFAQEPDYDRVNQIAKQMNCPTCVGINLADCRTLTCEQWRDQINDLLEQGYTEQEVLDYFANQYGTQVLLEPPKSGSTLALWVIPVIAVLAGGGWLIYLLRRWKQPQPASPAAQQSPVAGSSASLPPDDYLKQVEKDLEETN